MAKKETIRLRILAQCHPDGIQYQPNQVVDFPADVGKPLKDQGFADDSKESIAYCLDELKVEAIAHAAAAEQGQA